MNVWVVYKNMYEPELLAVFATQAEADAYSAKRDALEMKRHYGFGLHAAIQTFVEEFEVGAEPEFK